MKHICTLCAQEINQLQSRNRTRCNACNTKIRRVLAKERAIAHLGGKCADCGYIGPAPAFDFHHVDPSTKKFAIGAVANRAWHVILAELQKCVLLCRNCHNIRHSSRHEGIWAEAAKTYRKKGL